MAFESIDDEKIRQLLNCAKQVTNPRARLQLKEGHEQYNYKVVSLDDSGHEFEIYTRQNLRDGMGLDFSCGISWISHTGIPFTLRRYNGFSHIHRNQIEDELLIYEAHIHIATEKYINANRTPTGYAERTDRYRTLKGALHCLVVDCNISGINTEPDLPQLNFS